MRHKLVLWSVLLIAGFLAGFILQYSRVNRLQQNLSVSTKQLESCHSGEQMAQLRDTATMMYLETTQKNYGRAGEYSKKFLTKLSESRVALTIRHSVTCFVTSWAHAIRSRPTWQREMLPRSRRYS